jgi:hypothetical protein
MPSNPDTSKRRPIVDRIHYWTIVAAGVLSMPLGLEKFWPRSSVAQAIRAIGP